MGGPSQSKKIRSAAIWVFLALVLRAFAAVPPSPAFIPPQATVILLSGLPGDLQSETSYQSQLADWLELLPSLPNSPAQIIIFSDNPDSLTLPPKIAARKFKSSRAEFLNAAHSLASQTNPLVFIAWGHGGMQGNTPVFHVAGPRLTAADFKSVAAQSASPDSRWLLYFRGSGKFAAELAAGHRLIIASEKETMFNSDPIGLPLLFKSFRANPSLSFEALAAELGRATVAWYKDHNLVRTEEPTLFAASQTPQLLAPLETDSGPPATNADVAANAPSSIAATTNLPPTWTNITRIEPQNYPDADGVVLHRRITYTLSGSNPAITSESEDFIQVLTAEGKHLGDFDFAYSPPDEDITFLNLEVLLPGGKLLSLNPDEIRDAAGEAWGEYRADRRKIFSLPGIVPGAILRVHYQTSWKTFPMPYISRSIPLVGELPVVDAAVQVRVPKDAAFHFAFDQLTAADPAIKQTTYGSVYSWQFQNLPAAGHEILSPPFHEPSLLISTFPDWPAFIGWYSRISAQADTVTPAIAARAAELTAGCKTDSERAIKLFNFVTGLRYVAVPLGVNSFRPHAADEVLQHQYGDCKDKANLFNTLLHSQNINAHLVLVPRFSQARDNLPGFAFNHAISKIEVDQQTIWADTTDDVCRFGMLPPGDPGRKVLVFDSKSAALTELPAPTPNAHELRLDSRINLADGSVTMDASPRGFADYSMRTTAQATHGHKVSIPLIYAHLRPISGVFGLEKQTYSSPSALAQDFSWHAAGFFTGILTTNNAGQILRAPFWLPKEWDLALNHRTTPLFFNEGYPLMLDEVFDFVLPAAPRQINIPDNCDTTTEPLMWRIHWIHPNPTTITAQLHLELTRGELTMPETIALQTQLRALYTTLAAEANFALPP